MQLSMRTYLALLCGISGLLCTGSMNASVPETGTVVSTAAANETTDELFSTHVARVEEQPTTRELPHEGTGVTAKAGDVTTLSPKAALEVTTAHRTVQESTTGLVDKATEKATASSVGPQPLHTSTAEPRATSKVEQSSPSVAITETTKPIAATNSTVTTDTSAATSATTSAGTFASAATSNATSATTSAGPLATETSSSSLPSQPTTEAGVTSNFSSTTSPNSSTHAPDFTQNLGSPSASTATTMTATCVTVTRTTTTSTELPVTSRPVSVTRTHNPTSEFTDTDGSTSTAEPSTVLLSTASANSTTVSAVSTSPAGTFIPIKPKRLPIPTRTTQIPAATTAPHEVPKTTPSTETQTCSSRSLAKTCLIAIASLAGLATIFIITTIILCTKLSARKYKVRRPEPATEMMCISALLPEPSYSYTRQRNPVTNGVLVMHHAGDSDEEGGDNLTLSSFLPENDRYV